MKYVVSIFFKKSSALLPQLHAQLLGEADELRFESQRLQHAPLNVCERLPEPLVQYLVLPMDPKVIQDAVRFKGEGER